MGLLKFSGLSSVGASVNTPDGKYIATLTERSREGDNVRLTSTLTIQPPLNGLNITHLVCEGFTTENVENCTTIIISSEYD